MLSDFTSRIGRWWLREFLDIFPTSFADWLIDRGAKRLVISKENDAVTLEVSSERGRTLATTRVSHAHYGLDLIDEFLHTQHLVRDQVSIGLRLAAECVFARNLLLPAETHRTIDAVLARDLATKTPFRLEDVYSDKMVYRKGEQIHVWQWVVRRHFVEDAAKVLCLRPDDVAFIDSENQDDAPRPYVRLRSTSANENRWVYGTFVLLILTACGLAILAGGLKYRCQQNTLDGLTVELDSARARVQRVNAALRAINEQRAGTLQLQSKKRAPGLRDVWEEITRILPSHSWLTELRVTETVPGEAQQLVFSGLSPAAASLVAMIDRSTFFTDAALIAPISIDPTEGKERFVIQAKLQSLDLVRTAAQ